MTIAEVARPRVESSTRSAILALARIEGRLMLRNPAPWIGVVLTAWVALISVDDGSWASVAYEEILSSACLLTIGVSVSSVYAFARGHTPVSEDAPLSSAQRSAARLLGGLSLVALVTVVIGLGAVWLRVRGGIRLGDEPGGTDHAYYTAPELLQPILLAAFAVALGAVAVHLLRHKLASLIVVSLYWFVVGAWYWMFNSSGMRSLTSVQIQPVYVKIEPASTDPATFPSTWLLSGPSVDQEGWERLVISPALAASHDAYLVALTTLAIAIAVPGRFRIPVAIVGILLAVGAVLLQQSVSP
jgi:hypothetical protein